MTTRSRERATARNPRRGRTLAAQADRHRLYQLSVQEPEADLAFFNRVFRKRYDRRPVTLREDFCGTGYLSCAWVQDHRDKRAVGIDLDPDPLAWGQQHNVARLDEDQHRRLRFVQGNVLEVARDKADIVAALNFSYFCFKTRAELGAYFRAAYRNLARHGLFILDIEGGPDTQEKSSEPRRVQDFTYVWKQESFDPISHHSTCSISFRFRDGSALRRAFVYDWRIWTIPEIRELLAEAGFQRSEVYWEGTETDSNEGNGIFTHRERVENCDAWVSYLVGVKGSA